MENLQGGTLALDHHYHLHERLRSVGLTTTYTATQDPFEHPVTVTVYEGLADTGGSPELSDRIGEAAARASWLDSDGTLPVIDFGEIERGVPFIIERTVDGPTLADIMDTREVFTPSGVAELVERLAEILQVAHDRGIYHGDLRPHWVHFGDSDDFRSAHLSHFGLGLSMSQLMAMPQMVLTTDLVETFPPECFESVDTNAKPDDEPDAGGGDGDDEDRHLTAAADQWSLAAVAYRLLVGVHPFFDDPVDASDGMVRIKTEPAPPLAELGVEAAVSDAIDRALSSDPQQRWPTISDFAHALCRAVDGPDDATTDADDLPAQSPEPQTDTGDDKPDADQLDSPSLQTGGSPDAPPPGPRPSGYLLTAAIAALVLTNLGWFFMTMADEPADELEPSADATDADAADALPSGLQIRTEPDGAEISVLGDEDTEELLGPTPYILPDSMLENTPLQLALRHDDFYDQNLVFEQTETGKDIIVELVGPRDAE